MFWNEYGVGDEKPVVYIINTLLQYCRLCDVYHVTYIVHYRVIYFLLPVIRSPDDRTLSYDIKSPGDMDFHSL